MGNQLKKDLKAVDGAVKFIEEVVNKVNLGIKRASAVVKNLTEHKRLLEAQVLSYNAMIDRTDSAIVKLEKLANLLE